MTVLYWQLGIIISIVFVGWFSRLAGLALCIFWSIWTHVQIPYSLELQVIQTVLIWGAFLIVEYLKKQKHALSAAKGKLFNEIVLRETLAGRVDASENERITALMEGEKAKITLRTYQARLEDYKEELDRLTAALNEYSSEAARDKIREDLADDRYEIVKDKKHLSTLRSAINEATSEILVISGFINNKVVDHFENQIKSALTKGVKLTLVHGSPWEPTIKDKLAVEKLRLLSSRGTEPGLLEVYAMGTHEKILIKDNEFVICGSNNWLSNRHGTDIKETSVLFRSPELVSIFREKISKELEAAVKEVP